MARMEKETAASVTIESLLAGEIAVKAHQVRAAIRLLDSGATVPFIARYRKEATGGLTDVHLRLLAARVEEVRELETRRGEIVASILSQGRMNPTLQEALEAAATKSALEDLYLPFRPKRHTKAQAARDAGLEPLADRLFADPMLDPETEARAYADPVKGIADAAGALAGAREILAEWLAEDAALVGALRETFWNSIWVASSLSPSAPPSKREEAAKFSDYFDFREPIRKIPSHRALAILRGRQEEILRVSLEPQAYGDPAAADRDYLEPVLKRLGWKPTRRPGDPFLFDTARHAWRYKIRLHLELDAMSRLRRGAEDEAIRVFAENLRSLLLAAPAGPRPTLGLDPGFRTGVKCAVVDATGKVVATATVFPHPPENDWDRSTSVLATMIERYGVELVAIGNGTASRETEKLAADAIRRSGKPALKAVVSEAGASVYSASELATKELPTLDVSIRGAVSIARRLQDPLAELVKIDPKSIGVGQYQHDLNPTRLAKSLQGVVEDCVNGVGVDLNTASPSLLSYVSGLTRRAAENLVAWRDAHGAFKSRERLKDIPDFGPRTFEQAAGFLRIRGGENPLDASAVHPESYPVVERMLSKNSRALGDILGNSQFLRALSPEEYVDERFGVPTVEDILAELEKPGRDPRPEFRTAAFAEGVNTISDLKPGMILEGTVTNVAAFGAFVDIGVHQDGLVHVSQLAERFVRDPYEVVRTGQTVKVRVLEIDRPRNRIALTFRLKADRERDAR